MTRRSQHQPIFAMLCCILSALTTVSGDATSELVKVAADCNDFVTRCKADCHGGYSISCGTKNGQFTPESKCDCPMWGSQAQQKAVSWTPEDEATKELVKTATNCNDFVSQCKTGCSGGYSASCSRQSGQFLPSTKCDCPEWGTNNEAETTASWIPEDDATKELVKTTTNCNDFVSQCKARCPGGFSASCSSQSGEFLPSTKCDCPKWGVTEQSTADFLRDAYSAHNAYRRKHHVSPLRIDRSAERAAQKHAEYLASIDRMAHSGSKKFGENVYASSGIVQGRDAVDYWYNELKKTGYNFNGPESYTAGHFTQIVWKSSTGIGCGRATSTAGSGLTYVVCNYSPRGNVMTQFSKNVLPA